MILWGGYVDFVLENQFRTRLVMIWTFEWILKLDKEIVELGNVKIN